eukprot:scaffold130255_cov17-Tisochrysis_lutea.AAC.1
MVIHALSLEAVMQKTHKHLQSYLCMHNFSLHTQLLVSGPFLASFSVELDAVLVSSMSPGLPRASKLCWTCAVAEGVTS